MFKRFRFLGSIPVFPAALAVGALLLGLPWLKILLLGLLAVGLTLLCALFLAPKNEAEIPANWNRDLRKFRRILDKIQNRTVTRRGQEILAELKQCRSALPFLTKSARREITDYYLPTFLKFFNAYETWLIRLMEGYFSLNCTIAFSVNVATITRLKSIFASMNFCTTLSANSGS